MPPTGGTTGQVNFNLTGLFSAWVRSDGTGIGFDSSTGFRLPNRAVRSPDGASWLLTGTKQFITHGRTGDLIVAMAVTGTSGAPMTVNAMMVSAKNGGQGSSRQSASGLSGQAITLAF